MQIYEITRFRCKNCYVSKLCSRIDHVKWLSLPRKSICLLSYRVTIARRRRVASEIVLGCWRHLQDSASTWVYWTSVRVRVRHVLLTAARRRHAGQFVWDSWVSSRTSLPRLAETSSKSVLTHNNRLYMSHTQTNLPSYFNQIQLQITTSSSPSEVCDICAESWILTLHW